MTRHLDEDAIAAAKIWFDENFNGLPDTDALVRGVVGAYAEAFANKLTLPTEDNLYERVDPDIIVLGEIRDVETARLAIKASDDAPVGPAEVWVSPGAASILSGTEKKKGRS